MIQHDQYSHHKIPKIEEREQKIENIFEEMMTENFPRLVKKKRYLSPRSTGSPKQDEVKEAQDTL